MFHPPLFILSILAVAVPLQGADPPNPPSKLENPIKEADLPTLKLTPKAVARLGIATAPIERKAMPQARLFAGIVRLPLVTNGSTLTPAPISGAEELRKLAELQTTADGAIAAATAAHEAAVIAQQRAETLAKANAGSERLVDEAKAAAIQAAVARETATAQRTLLGRSAAEAGQAPERWITVGIPSVELAHLDLTSPVTLRVLGGKPGGTPLTAKPVVRPPSTLPNGAVEICYDVAAPQLLPGQQIEVSIAVSGGQAESLIAPWSAVIHDATGGAWVYEQTAPEAFVRRRVSVVRVAGETAILAAGPPVGTKIVTVGVAELFGAEFGGFK